jgi:hypothetical protein
MKAYLFSLLLAALPLWAQPADNVALSGKWEVHSNVAGNESRSTCAFTHKGSELTGSCEGSRGKVEISGKVEGTDVSWMYKSEYEGSPLTVRFKGKLESAARIAGTVSVEEFNVDGDFTATRAAASARADREFPPQFRNSF